MVILSEKRDDNFEIFLAEGRHVVSWQREKRSKEKEKELGGRTRAWPAILLLLTVTNRPNGHHGSPEIEIERFSNGQRG